MSNFKDNSAQAIKALQEAAYKGMTKAVEHVEGQAKLNAPVDTGALEQSIGNQVTQNGADTRGYVGTNQDYAIPIEFGTGEHATNGAGRSTPWSYQRADGVWITTTGNPAQPFLEPAFKDSIDSIKKMIESELGEVGD